MDLEAIDVSGIDLPPDDVPAVLDLAGTVVLAPQLDLAGSIVLNDGGD